MNINPGELNQRITIQKKLTKKDDLKNQISEWIDYVTCWAKINGLFGSEYYAAKAVSEENTLEIIIRHSKKVDEINTVDYRVVFQGKEYDIKNKDHVKFNGKWVKLKALEK